MLKPTDDMLDRYDYADDPALKALHALDRLAMDETYSYGASSRFGRQMMAHQNRVARDGAAFLRYLGYSDRAAKNFRTAMLFHDIGKTHASYDPASWMLDKRPTKEEKAHQRRHARLGFEMFQSLTDKVPDLLGHPHFQVRGSVTLYHHERADRTGPEKIDILSLPVFVQVSCIVDSYDGDRIKRPHQEHQRTQEEALARMAGQSEKKYIGAFDKKLLQRYIDFKTATT